MSLAVQRDGALRQETMSGRILSVSQHKTVLDTRNAVLRSAGYEVVTTMDLSEAEKIVADGQSWTAAVLGDSIPSSKRLALARKLKQIVPGLPVVMLIRSHDSIPDRNSVDDWINALEGPEALLESLRSLARK